LSLAICVFLGPGRHEENGNKSNKGKGEAITVNARVAWLKLPANAPPAGAAALSNG
jgi:hypothetical protein